MVVRLCTLLWHVRGTASAASNQDLVVEYEESASSALCELCVVRALRCASSALCELCVSVVLCKEKRHTFVDGQFQTFLR